MPKKIIKKEREMFEELKPVFKETLKSAEEYHRLKHLLFNTHSKTSKNRLFNETKL
jgi:hypothetical protein